MTPRQFQIEFERARKFLDQNRFQQISFTTEDIQYFLNEAINVIITKKLKTSKKESRNGIKVSQRELDEIRSLLVKNISLVKDVGLSNLEYDVYTLPDDYYFLISDKSSTISCSVTKVYQNRLYSTENLYEILEDTHFGTKYNSPVSELSTEKLYVYKNSNFTIDSVIIDYIKKWIEIDILNNINTDLNENIHKQIVNVAVNIAYENIDNNKFRINTEKNQITDQISLN